MITAILHTHLLVVILFLLLFLVKAFLLFSNRHDTLNKARTSTKMLDLVFGVLLLVTGGYLVFSYTGALPTWLLLKMMLVLAAIPVAIVGLKRHSKILTGVALLVFLYVYAVSETKSLKMRPDKEETVAIEPHSPGNTVSPDSTQGSHPIFKELEGTQLQNAQAIYTNLCANCHGADGQRGTGGAPNLQQSTLSQADRKIVITQGRGLMPGFGSQLSEQEIDALALYTTLLKK